MKYAATVFLICVLLPFEAGCKSDVDLLTQETQKAKQEASKLQTLVGQAQGAAKVLEAQTEQNVKTGQKVAQLTSEAWKEGQELDSKVPPEEKPLTQQHLATLHSLSLGVDDWLAGDQKALNQSLDLNINLKVTSDAAAGTVAATNAADNAAHNVQDEVKAAESKASLWRMLIAYGCLVLGLAGGGAFFYVKYAALAWLPDKLKGPALAGVGIISSALIAGYFIIRHETLVEIVLVALGVLVALYLVAKLIFFRESTKGIATAVQAAPNAVDIATAANPITPTGLGAWLGKLKLLVKSAPSTGG